MATKHIFITGIVQGVSYRASAASTGCHLKVTGWVRNLTDGRVEIIATGSSGQLAAFEAWLRQGPPAARVDKLDIDDVPEQTFNGFEIRFDGP